MELFGIGLPEVFFIIVIALIVLGPKDMAVTGRKMGAWLRKLITSPGWRVFQDTSQEIRNLPTKLMREAGMDELEQQAREINQELGSALDKNNILPPGEIQSFRNLATPPARSIENPVAPTYPDVEQNKDDKTS